MNIVTQGTVFT